MRAAIYARVSTDTQTTENQLIQLRAWASELGYDLVAEYVDCESGARDDRPGLQKLLSDGNRRRFQTVLFWSLDRLTRGGVARTLAILQQFSARGLKFRSLQQDFIDTDGPFGELLIAVFAALADIERRQHAERTRAGLQRARLRGAHFGRPRRMVDVHAIQSLMAAGYTGPQIAQRLAVSYSTIRRRLHGAKASHKEAASNRPTSSSELDSAGRGNSICQAAPVETTPASGAQAAEPASSSASTSAAYRTEAAGAAPEATREGPAL